MDFSFLFPRHETALTVRQKAEALLAQAEDAALLIKNKTTTGETRLNITGREGDFRQFRHYRAEDRPQDIDWKRSARSDDLLIKEREKNQRQAINLWFAPSPGMNFKSSTPLATKHETAAIIATTFALWAKKNYSLIYLNGHQISIDDFAYEALDIKRPPEPKHNALTILIGDFLEDFHTLENLFSQAPARDTVVLQILDPAECDLPYHGRSVFEFGPDKTTINDVDAVRDDYKAALGAHMRDIQNSITQRNWYYELVRTDQKLSASLVSVFHKIGERA